MDSNEHFHIVCNTIELQLVDLLVPPIPNNQLDPYYFRQKLKFFMKNSSFHKYIFNSAIAYHKSPTATELDKYNPDISHDPVTASRPHTENTISAHLECLATPTNRTAHKINNSANIATVPGQRISS